MIRSIGLALFRPPSAAEDGLSLRTWFVGFVGWLSALTVLASLAFVAYENGSRLGMVLWLAALFMFYLSLCNTFFPAPTAWIVMMLASNYVAGEVGVLPHTVGRLITVATAGALATAMANLNEYHVWTFLLRYGRLGSIRKTRIFDVASRWFGVRPFWTIVLFSFIPIPVDVIRWLAITCRYPRMPYFLAYYVGRWVRYASLAAVTIWGSLTLKHIVIIQCTIAGIALAKIVQQFVRRHRAKRHRDDHDMPGAPESDTISKQTVAPPQLSNMVE